MYKFKINRRLDVQALLNELKGGTISNSIYDQAYILRSGVLDTVAFQKLTQILISQQASDGSWGASNYYIHDRVINTLSAVIALIECGNFQNEIQSALGFLNSAIPKLLTESVEPIAFELTFLSLLDEIEAKGFKIEKVDKVINFYEQMRFQKLKAIAASKLISSSTTLAHSLEAIPIDIETPETLISDNGSVGNSPAATAFLAKKIGRYPKSVEYLLQFKNLEWDVPSIYPFEVFEKAWVLHTLQHARALDGVDYKVHTDYLWKHWMRYGAATIADSFPLVDSDDTAVVYTVLKQSGYPVDVSVFSQFEQEKWFRCFELERNPSISANIHILEALNMSTETAQIIRWKKKIISFLAASINKHGAWVDKWHISPFYCTAHAVLALRNVSLDLQNKAIGFIMRSQNKDGGWGIVKSTHEETLYALQALKISGVVDNNSEMFNKARIYLEATQNEFEPLWVDKGLYCPISVVKSLSIYGFEN